LTRGCSQRQGRVRVPVPSTTRKFEASNFARTFASEHSMRASSHPWRIVASSQEDDRCCSTSQRRACGCG
jgi:hypothetical protein